MALFSDVLLTVDYDRTLTAPDSTIPQRNLEAIRYFMENGGAFTVNTGRSLPMVQDMLKAVPINVPLLLCNGSAAYDTQTGEVLFLHRIPLDAEQTVHTLMEMFPDCPIELQGMKAHYRLKYFPMWDELCKNSSCAHVALAPGEYTEPFIKICVFDQLTEPFVSSLFNASQEEIRRFDTFEQQIVERFGEYCTVYRSAPRIIDIHAKGVSKGKSARQLQKALSRKILVCVGDERNDLTMLREADYPFITGDSCLAGQFPSVCPCAEGAVADVIYNKIPEILEKNLDKQGVSC